MRSASSVLKVILLLFLLPSCIKWENPPTRGLVLYMAFDGNLYDLSEYRNDGINYTSGNYVKGKWGKALDFNGTSDFVKLSKNIVAENGLSFSFWLKSRGAAGTENNGSIVCKYNMTSHRRSFMIYSFGAFDTRNINRISAAYYKYSNTSSVHDHVRSYMDNEELAVFPDPTLWTIISPKTIETDKWTHCVVNVTPAEIQVWLNGDLCVKKTREYDQYADNPDEPIYIGNNLAIGEGDNNHFNGTLDELRIYNRELSKKEILLLYHNK